MDLLIRNQVAINEKLINMKLQVDAVNWAVFHANQQMSFYIYNYSGSDKLLVVQQQIEIYHKLLALQQQVNMNHKLLLLQNQVNMNRLL